MGIADEIALLVLQSSTCSARNAPKRSYKQYMVAKSEGLQCSLVDGRCWIMVNPCPIESMISISVSPIGSDLPLDPPITIVIVCCVLWIKHTKKLRYNTIVPKFVQFIRPNQPPYRYRGLILTFCLCPIMNHLPWSQTYYKIFIDFECSRYL